MLLVMLSTYTQGQISTFPYSESFDAVTVPALPAGWSTSIKRLASGDFTSTTSSPRSAPNTLISTNPTITQWLVSPRIDFTNRVPDRLQFNTARSSTHLAGLLVEASLDGGTTFPIALTDTIRNPGVTTFVLTPLTLPPSLVNQPNVRFRWTLVEGGSHTAGVFRLDDVTLTIQTQYDLAVTKLVAQPAFPTSTESLTLLASVKNLSAQAASGYAVEFYRDINGNGAGDPNEKFSTVSGPQLAQNDSITLSATHQPLGSGDHRFIARLMFAVDENRSNDSATVLVSVGVAKGAVVINEIMYAPTGDEPEWVELFNTTQESLNLKNWRISDNNVGTKTVISAGDFIIAPGGFAVVAKDAIFSTIHPGVNVPIVVANFSALNNTTPDAVVIYDHRLATIDSLTYDPKWGGSGGKSLERIDYMAPSTLSSNWVTSEDSLGRTPGKVNSRARLNDDLTIRRVAQSRVQSGSITVPRITVVVANEGRLPAQGYTVRFFADKNGNALGEPDELLQSIAPTGSLAPLDSLSLQYDYQTAPAGETTILLVLDYSRDERVRNNTAQLKVQSRYEDQVLVINEIMYDPLKDENEWIEFYHRGSSPVDLARWKFSDRPTASGSVNTFTITTQSRIIRPGEFVVVAAESTIVSRFPQLTSPLQGMYLFILNRTGGLSLGNDGDDIILRDITDSVIDSVRYSPKWHHPDLSDTKGRSLERINPNISSNDSRNWSSAATKAGGTPGLTNSIFAITLPSTASLKAQPNPFSPDGDGFEDFCLLRYNLPMTTSLIRIKVFDTRGRLIRTLANSEPGGSGGEIVWDGMDDSRQRVRVGPYVAFIEAIDNQGGIVASAKAVVVVATKL